MKIAIVTVAAFAGAATAGVSTLASQNFDDNSTAPQITNNADLGTLVGHFSDGSGLGFGTSWVDSRGTGMGGPVDGAESGDFIGVPSFTGDVGNFTSGAQGYQFNDVDGALSLDFASIDASGFSGLELTFDLFINSTTYEPDDFFNVVVNGTTIYTLGELDLEGTAGSWQTIVLDLGAYDGLSSVQISIVGDTNASTENFYVDTVAVTGVPAPASIALVGLGGLVAARRRRA